MKTVNKKIHNIYQKFYYQLLKRHFFAITGPWRVLPNLIVIGAVRSGTTSLFHYFNEHPCMTSSSYDELGFFDSNFELGLNWYKSHFPTKFHKQKIISKFKKFYTYDVTPFYIWNENAAKRILDTLPNTKLIALLRNPIDRAYSNYQLSVRDDEKQSFEEVIKKEMKQGKNFKTKAYGLQNYLARGIYVNQLEKWYKLFPKKNILVISTDELKKDPENTLNSMFQFLDIPKYKVKNLKKHNKENYKSMNNETRKFLVDFFKEDNKKLFKLIGKKFDWDK